MLISFDGTFYTITDPQFEMSIPAWDGYEPDTADAADATITFPDGSRRYATFMTSDVIQKVMSKDARTGECSGGRYFWCSDLIIIRDAGFAGMAAAIRDLIGSGEIEGACGLLDPADDAASGERPRPDRPVQRSVARLPDELGPGGVTCGDPPAAPEGVRRSEIPDDM